MRRLFELLLFFVGLSAAWAGPGTLTELPASRNVEGRVFYFGFEIERITGIPEKQISDYGCAYLVDRKSFLRLLSTPTRLGAQNYDETDVRAVIRFADSTLYFVDYQGVVRTGRKIYLLEKSDFVAILKPVVRGRCRP